jgi:hypothetical protein
MKSTPRRVGMLRSMWMTAGLVAVILAWPREPHTRGWIRADFGKHQGWACPRYGQPPRRCRVIVKADPPEPGTYCDVHSTPLDPQEMSVPMKRVYG